MTGIAPTSVCVETAIREAPVRAVTAASFSRRLLPAEPIGQGATGYIGVPGSAAASWGCENYDATLSYHTRSIIRLGLDFRIHHKGAGSETVVSHSGVSSSTAEHTLLWGFRRMVDTANRNAERRFK